MQGRVRRLLPRQVQHEALQQLQQSQADLRSALRGRWRRSRRLAPRLPGLSCSLLLPAMAAPRAAGAKAASAEGARTWEGGQHLGHLPLALGPVTSLPTPPTLNHCSLL